jgi:hypothetical protein
MPLLEQRVLPAAIGVCVQMTKIHKTRVEEFTEIWGYPIGRTYGSHKLGQVGPHRPAAMVSRRAAK